MQIILLPSISSSWSVYSHIFLLRRHALEGPFKDIKRYHRLSTKTCIIVLSPKRARVPEPFKRDVDGKKLCIRYGHGPRWSFQLLDHIAILVDYSTSSRCSFFERCVRVASEPSRAQFP